jgi:uncharacterized DUF497 family protein
MQKFGGELLLYQCSVRWDRWTVNSGAGQIEVRLSNLPDEDEIELYAFEGTIFEWNRVKAESNVSKHGVSFGEGATVFGDVDGVMIPDPDHSEEESRFVLVGRSRLRRLLVVVSVERGERVRLISARRAGRKEKKVYEEGRQN